VDDIIRRIVDRRAALAVQERAAAERERAAAQVAAEVRADLLTALGEAFALVFKGFNPDQPRIPAGQHGGGRWVGAAGLPAFSAHGERQPPPRTTGDDPAPTGPAAWAADRWKEHQREARKPIRQHIVERADRIKLPRDDPQVKLELEFADREARGIEQQDIDAAVKKYEAPGAAGISEAILGLYTDTAVNRLLLEHDHYSAWEMVERGDWRQILYVGPGWVKPESNGQLTCDYSRDTPKNRRAAYTDYINAALDQAIRHPREATKMPRPYFMIPNPINAEKTLRLSAMRKVEQVLWDVRCLAVGQDPNKVIQQLRDQKVLPLTYTDQ
jgi:hypothetical protein